MLFSNPFVLDKASHPFEDLNKDHFNIYFFQINKIPLVSVFFIRV